MKWKNSNSQTKRLPPGPWKLPLLGSMFHLLGGLLHHVLRDLSKNYGPLMHLQLGEGSLVVVTFPDVAKQVLKTYDLAFASRPKDLAVQILFYNGTDIVFSPYGDYWRQMHKICLLELLSTKNVKSFRSIRRDEVLYMVEFFVHLLGKIMNVHYELDSILENIVNEHKNNGELEGEDTSSTTIDWATVEMMKNPSVLANAQAEVRNAFRGKETFDENDVEELKYLKLVIKETFRLHPLFPLLLPRECREEVDISDYTIPLKTKVMVNVWAIGRDPKYWNDAESFKPERFEHNYVDFIGNNFEYLPFGSGRRVCPGISFALANIYFPLAQLLYQFDWSDKDTIDISKKLDNGQVLEVFVCHIVGEPELAPLLKFVSDGKGHVEGESVIAPSSSTAAPSSSTVAPTNSHAAPSESIIDSDVESIDGGVEIRSGVDEYVDEDLSGLREEKRKRRKKEKEERDQNILKGKLASDEPCYLFDEAASFETDSDDVTDEEDEIE
ncbi:hypothetical protein BC332_01729 [Capsicum chinense]|nr:hypothetical protein BC332_01729 [Capsicum chinense]